MQQKTLKNLPEKRTVTNATMKNVEKLPNYIKFRQKQS